MDLVNYRICNSKYFIKNFRKIKSSNEEKSTGCWVSFGGIASALRLRRLGFNVTILERLDRLEVEQGFLKSLVILLMQVNLYCHSC